MLLHPGRRNPRLDEPWIRLQVSQEQRLAGEDRPEVHLLRRVAASGVEFDGISAGVNERTLASILGEYRQHPALFDLGNHQAIVRDEPLDAQRELGQEPLRIEDGLQGVADGGERSQQVGKRRVHTVSVLSFPVRGRDAPLALCISRVIGGGTVSAWTGCPSKSQNRIRRIGR